MVDGKIADEVLKKLQKKVRVPGELDKKERYKG